MAWIELCPTCKRPMDGGRSGVDDCVDSDGENCLRVALTAERALVDQLRMELDASVGSVNKLMEIIESLSFSIECIGDEPGLAAVKRHSLKLIERAREMKAKRR